MRPCTPQVVLAVDPGTKHLAYCVHNGRVGETATQVPVEQVKGARTEHVLQDIRRYSRRFGKLLDRVRPDCVVFERFMYRPGLGLAGEFINIMLGKLIDKCDHRQIEVLLVMPAQHKVWFKKQYGVDPKEYRGFRRLGTEHECDAASLALFTKQVWYARSHELLRTAEARVAAQKQHRSKRHDRRLQRVPAGSQRPRRRARVR